MQLNYLWWLSLTAVLSIGDLLLGANFFLLVLAAGSLCLALVSYIWPNILWQEQILLFALVSVVLGYFWTKHVKKSVTNNILPKLNQRANQLIGRQAVLLESTVAGYAQVKLDDSFWKVYSTQALTKGTIVEILDVKNLTLVVQAIDEH